MAGCGWVDQAQDRLICCDTCGDEDSRHDRQSGEALGVLGAQRERDTERDRRQGVPTVVDQVGQQRQAAAEREHQRLHRGSNSEDRERQHNDPDTLAGALDALVHETVRVTVSMLVAVVGVVFVWSRVRVGVTRRAVPMQVALDEFVGSS